MTPTQATILNSRSAIAKLDKSNVLGSIEALPQQISDAWQQSQNINFPQKYQQAQNIVIASMGGSALGSKVIKNLYKDQLKVSFEIISHYQLPNYVNSNSLILLSSYSGNTEEILACAQDAITRKAMIMVITSGGKLFELAQQHQWPCYTIKPTYNPSNQPRMAIGYSIIGQLSLFSKLRYIKLQTETLTKLSQKLSNLAQTLSPDNEQGNMAKLLAYHAYDKFLVLSGAEHLVGAVHVLNNQLNENAKLLTAEWHLPEFNHHYMEALTNPKKLKEDVLFILFNSHLYSDRVNKRVHLTSDIIKQAGFEAEVIEAIANTKLEQVFEIIMLGGFFNFYLAMLYQLDPAPIPNVSKFKLAMKK